MSARRLRSPPVTVRLRNPSMPHSESDNLNDFDFHLLGLPIAEDGHAVRSREPFELLVTQFVDELRKGEKPSIELYAKRFPPHAERVRDVFPVLAMLEHARIDKEARSIRQNMPGSIPFTRLGNCELLQELGRGGMGVVFRARDLSSGHMVAVKVLPWRVSVVPEWVARFEREARTVQQLHHPGIVPVFRYGQENGYCFFVMKLIHGASLDRVIRSLGAGSTAGLDLQELIPVTNTPSSADTASAITLPKQQPTASTQTSLRLTPAAWQEFARIGLQAAHALHAAHSAGICHNDIKPGNLLLENTGHVWVTDFGLSQPISTPPTPRVSHPANAQSILGPMTRKAQAHVPDISSHSCGGTLKYMAPERLLGQQSEAADLYSLGATLYELCLQCTPFDHEQRDQLRQIILEQPPMAPSDLCRDFPRGLETIILNCLEKNPANRYATAQQLIHDLLRFTRGHRIRRTRSNWLSAGVHRLRNLFR